ncbi:MAG: hypothetical protein MJ016_03700 [Victivallaceae bacterium]|nr:hypothetical protein [Victivallaceae bacterium]
MQILFERAEIARRVAELGREISAFYRGKPLLCTAVVNGAMFFAADLVREISLPLKFDSIAAASYVGGSSSGELHIRTPMKLDPAGMHVLLIDEVLDTGLTLARLKADIEKRGAASVRTVVAVDKRRPRVPGGLEHADWTGFEAPNRYLIGYGMDADELYRNLSGIAVFDPRLTEINPFK